MMQKVTRKNNIFKSQGEKIGQEELQYSLSFVDLIMKL